MIFRFDGTIFFLHLDDFFFPSSDSMKSNRQLAVTTAMPASLALFLLTKNGEEYTIIIATMNNNNNSIISATASQTLLDENRYFCAISNEQICLCMDFSPFSSLSPSLNGAVCFQHLHRVFSFFFIWKSLSLSGGEIERKNSNNSIRTAIFLLLLLSAFSSIDTIHTI